MTNESFSTTEEDQGNVIEGHAAIYIYSEPNKFWQNYVPLTPEQINGIAMDSDNQTALIVNGSELAQEKLKAPNTHRGIATAETLMALEDPSALAFIGFFGGGTYKGSEFIDRKYGGVGPNTEAIVMFHAFLDRLDDNNYPYNFKPNKMYDYSPENSTYGWITTRGGLYTPIKLDELSGTTDQNFYNISGPLGKYGPVNIVVGAGDVRPSTERAIYILARTLLTQPSINVYPEWRDMIIHGMNIKGNEVGMRDVLSQEGLASVLKDKRQTEKALYYLAVNGAGGVLNVFARRTFMLTV